MKDEITELLGSILKAIVDKPGEVKIEKTVDEMGVLLSVKLGEGDAGLVIGRQGKTIQSIRYLMAVIGSKNRARINVKLDVPERGPRKYGEGDPAKKPTDIDIPDL